MYVHKKIRSHLSKHGIVSELDEGKIPAVSSESRKREDELLVISIQKIEEEDTGGEDDELGGSSEVDEVKAQNIHMAPAGRNSLNLDFKLALSSWSPSLRLIKTSCFDQPKKTF